MPPTASERRPRPSREALRVDQVGDVAAALSARVQVGARPRVIKTRLELASAPIDHRDAFVLSLVDGRMTVQQLVDVSGMPEDEVLTILARLRRLAILAL